MNNFSFPVDFVPGFVIAIIFFVSWLRRIFAQSFR